MTKIGITNMTAYDDLFNDIKQNQKILSRFREELISSRGSFISGKIPEYMDLKMKRGSAMVQNEEDDHDENENLQSENVSRLFIHSDMSPEDYGFVFSPEGTLKAIDAIMGGQKINIANDYIDKFLFKDAKKECLWKDIGLGRQRKLIADDIDRMVKKTLALYRTHGDRMHYFVLGKITITSSNLNSRTPIIETFPLILFSCINTDKLRMSMEIEQSGFINFWLDKNRLEGILKDQFGGFEVEIGRELINKLDSAQQKISKLQFSQYDKVEIDPTFSMIGTITGFEAEYADKAWEAMLDE